MKLSAILYNLMDSTEDFVASVLEKQFSDLPVSALKSGEELLDAIEEASSALVFFHQTSLTSFEPILRQSRNKQEDRKVKFILIYNHRNLPLDFDHCRSLGVDFFLEVPFVPQELIEYIRQNFPEIEFRSLSRDKNFWEHNDIDEEIIETINNPTVNVNLGGKNDVGIIESELDPTQQLLGLGKEEKDFAEQGLDRVDECPTENETADSENFSGLDDIMAEGADLNSNDLRNGDPTSTDKAEASNEPNSLFSSPEREISVDSTKEMNEATAVAEEDGEDPLASEADSKTERNFVAEQKIEALDLFDKKEENPFVFEFEGQINDDLPEEPSGEFLDGQSLRESDGDAFSFSEESGEASEEDGLSQEEVLPETDIEEDLSSLAKAVQTPEQKEAGNADAFTEAEKNFSDQEKYFNNPDDTEEAEDLFDHILFSQSEKPSTPSPEENRNEEESDIEPLELDVEEIHVLEQTPAPEETAVPAPNQDATQSPGELGDALELGENDEIFPQDSVSESERKPNEEEDGELEEIILDQAITIGETEPTEKEIQDAEKLFIEEAISGQGSDFSGGDSSGNPYESITSQNPDEGNGFAQEETKPLDASEPNDENIAQPEPAGPKEFSDKDFSKSPQEGDLETGHDGVDSAPYLGNSEELPDDDTPATEIDEERNAFEEVDNATEEDILDKILADSSNEIGDLSEILQSQNIQLENQARKQLEQSERFPYRDETAEEQRFEGGESLGEQEKKAHAQDDNALIDEILSKKQNLTVPDDLIDYSLVSKIQTSEKNLEQKFDLDSEENQETVFEDKINMSKLGLDDLLKDNVQGKTQEELALESNWEEIDELSMDDITNSLNQTIEEFEENYKSQIKKYDSQEALDALGSPSEVGQASEGKNAREPSSGVEKAQNLNEEFNAFNDFPSASETRDTTPAPEENLSQTSEDGLANGQGMEPRNGFSEFDSRGETDLSRESVKAKNDSPAFPDQNDPSEERKADEDVFSDPPQDFHVTPTDTENEASPLSQRILEEEFSSEAEPLIIAENQENFALSSNEADATGFVDEEPSQTAGETPNPSLADHEDIGMVHESPEHADEWKAGQVQDFSLSSEIDTPDSEPGTLNPLENTDKEQIQFLGDIGELNDQNGKPDAAFADFLNSQPTDADPQAEKTEEGDFAGTDQNLDPENGEDAGSELESPSVMTSENPSGEPVSDEFSELQNLISEKAKSVKEEFSSFFTAKDENPQETSDVSLPEEDLEEVPLSGLFEQNGEVPQADELNPYEESMRILDTREDDQEGLSFSMDQFNEIKKSVSNDNELPEPTINPSIFNINQDEFSQFFEESAPGTKPKFEIITDEETKLRVYRYSEEEITLKLKKFEKDMNNLQSEFKRISEEFGNPPNEHEK